MSKVLTPSILIKIKTLLFKCVLRFISIEILKRGVTLLDFGYFPWLIRLTFLSGI